MNEKQILIDSIDRFNDFTELFSHIRELSFFEVDSQGFLDPNFNQGIESFGYNQEDVQKGLNALQLFIPEQHTKIMGLLSHSLGDVKQEDREYTGLRKNGSTFSVLIFSKPLMKAKKQVGRRGIVIDITDLKEIEKERELIHERRKQFIKIVNHELRSPINTIAGFIEFLRSSDERVSKEKKEKYFEQITVNIERLSAMVDNISDLTKIEKGILRLEKKNENFCEFFNRYINSFEMLLGDQIVYSGCNRSNVLAFIDKKKIMSVFDNVIDNAVNHTSKKNRKISVEVIFEIHEVLVKISDNGAGIEPQNINKIFEPFITIPTEFSVKGTGIGLFVSKEILEKHGGTITVRSKGKNYGSTFLISIPIVH